MADLSKLRELVAQSCRVLGKLNLTKEPSGHVSARVPGEERVSDQSARAGGVGAAFCLRARHHHRRFQRQESGRRRRPGNAARSLHPHLALQDAPRCSMRRPCASVDRRAVHDLRQAFATSIRRVRSVGFAPAGGRAGDLPAGALPYPVKSSAKNSPKRWARKQACLMRGHGITSAGAERRRSDAYGDQTQRNCRDQLSGFAAWDAATDSAGGHRYV